MADQIEDSVLLYKHLPKQMDIDRLSEQINRKVLRNTHLTGSIRDFEAAYHDSPHFRDLYIYLQNKRVPSNKKLAKRMEIQVNNYLLLDKLLFKLIYQIQWVYTPLYYVFQVQRLNSITSIPH